MTTTAIGKISGEGAYNNNDVFRYLSDNGILPCRIKVSKKAQVGWKKRNFLRNLSVMSEK